MDIVTFQTATTSTSSGSNYVLALNNNHRYAWEMYISDEEILVMLTPWRPFERAERVNMAKGTVNRLKVGGSGEVTVRLMFDVSSET